MRHMQQLADKRKAVCAGVFARLLGVRGARERGKASHLALGKGWGYVRQLADHWKALVARVILGVRALQGRGEK